MLRERANVQRNVEKVRLINRQTYLRTEKRCEDVYVERNAGKRNYCPNVAIYGKKSITED